ncbi:MAG TPA: beta/gamma crystallin-related protein, partial [Caulobacter sp.]|nr:beta/gamma crystallin-related protein [Caulobacter sp.]
GPVGLIVYENPDYRGMRLEISQSVTDLAGSGLEDQITSVRVMRGTWLLCAGRDFNGDCQTVSADTPNLKTIGLNDRVTSI